jgi:Tol biopolymer transport system component
MEVFQMNKKGFWLISVVMMLLIVALTAAVAQAAGPALSPEAQQATPPQAEVIVTALNVREGPGVNYRIVDVARQGDQFDVAGTNAAQTWLQIDIGDGNTAWISGWPDYTRVTGSLAALPVVQPTAMPVAAPATTGPAGGKLVFMTGSGGDIYRINADGAGLQLLTSGGLDPALSPDGQQVAFTRWGPTEGVYLINADGSNEHQIHPAHEPKSPTWSADGSEILFTLPRGGRLETTKECKTSSKDSSDDANLPPDAYDVSRKSYENAEGETEYKYCYSLPPKPAWQLRRVDVATGQYQDVDSDYASFGPTWDQSHPWRVVYSGDVSLVQLDLNQNTRTSLVEGTFDRTPAFSPDGTRLAVTHKQNGGQWAIDLINLDTGERVQLASQGNNVAPTWSPDGAQIAFLSDRAGQYDIWVMNADGSNQRPMMFAPGTLVGISFRYDGNDERMLSWGP